MDIIPTTLPVCSLSSLSLLQCLALAQDGKSLMHVVYEPNTLLAPTSCGYHRTLALKPEEEEVSPPTATGTTGSSLGLTSHVPGGIFFDSLLVQPTFGAFGDASAVQLHAYGIASGVALDSPYGNDGESGRVRGHCAACRIVGAHFDPRPLCSFCPGSDSDAVVIVRGMLPPPPLATTLAPPVKLAATYTWRDLCGLVVRCGKCRRTGPVRNTWKFLW